MSKITEKMENHQKYSNSEVSKKYVEAENLYREGVEAWRRGERGRAMSLYAESAELDPDGPARHALEMADDIMSFFDPNQFNP